MSNIPLARLSQGVSATLGRAQRAQLQAVAAVVELQAVAAARGHTVDLVSEGFPGTTSVTPCRIQMILDFGVLTLTGRDISIRFNWGSLGIATGSPYSALLVSCHHICSARI